MLFALNLNAKDVELVVQTGHSSGINQIIFLPGGNQFFTCSNDNTIKYWDYLSGREIYTLNGHKHSVLCMDLSNNGIMLVSGGDVRDMCIKTWHVKTGKMLNSFSFQQGKALAVAISPDEEKIAYIQALNTFETAVHVINANSGSPMFTLKTNKSFYCKDIDFSPNGKYLAVGGKFLKREKDDNIVLFDANTGNEAHVFAGTCADINKVTFSYDGSYLLSGGFCMQLWKMSDFTLYTTLPGSSNLTVYDPQANFAALARGKDVLIYDLVKNELSKTLSNQHANITALAISPNGEAIITADSKSHVNLWDLKSGIAIDYLNAPLPDHINTILLDKPEHNLFVGINSNNLVQWDLTGLKKQDQKTAYHLTNKKR
ncbi:MAG: hypothetical protein HC896_17545 [Bacteroidales bacterium]|nr:hypothetical protein [Bacteroidales bacterium]